MNIPTSGLREYIVALAERHGVVYIRTPMDDLAETISQLSDSEVDPDEIENLLVALKRAGVITHQDFVMLLGNYLNEERNFAEGVAVGL